MANISIKTTIFCLSVLLLNVPATNLIAGERHHRHSDAHVHGLGHVNFAVDGSQVHLELAVPAFDILGFESMTTQSQRSQLGDALRTLEKEELWSFSSSAHCRLNYASASESEVMMSGKKHHKHHDSHHKHGDSHSGQDQHRSQQHMVINARYTYECSDIGKLDHISTLLFQEFRNSQQLKVQGIVGSGQIAGKMNREQPEVQF